MGKPTGFMEFPRELPQRRPVAERVKDFDEVYEPFPLPKVQQQAARCMDCGVPFCQSGCPLGNIIPDWNDLVYRGRWRSAFERLRATNNFPEFTGRICPAPCETACVLGVTDPPVTIEQIEKEIIERAYAEGWVGPNLPDVRTGRRIAVVGSGPAGMAAADQMNRAGHDVTVFERHDRIGGLLRYGIPDFKLEKWVVDRRISLMQDEGIEFVTGTEVGRDLPASELADFDAVILCGGATKPRDLPIPGRDLDGIHFAWDFLHRQNKLVAGDEPEAEGFPAISAAGKHVIVIGGGDTGSDCIGTSNRQGAASVTQFELFPVPPRQRPEHQPWPYYPMVLRTSSSHEEGVERKWSVMTKSFEGSDGRVQELVTVDVDLDWTDGRPAFNEKPGTRKKWPADLVLLAIGYTGPETDNVVDALKVDLDDRGNVRTGLDYMTNRDGVFSAGDMRRGQSLVVWAISEGREAARAADAYLMGHSELPTKGGYDLPQV